jgi:hypothetical protein
MLKETLPKLPWTALLLLVSSCCLLPIQAQWGPAYLYWILLAGPVLFVPWGLGLLSKRWPAQQLLFTRLLPFAGMILVAAFCLPSGGLAASLAGVWLLVVAGLGVWAGRRFRELPLAALLAITFLWVAAAWAFADRLGWRPLGFDPLIVLLTAIHFHYAGFALALMTAFLPKSAWQITLSKGLIVGVAGVAVGITSTQLQGPAWIEVTAVTLMVLVGWGVALLQWYEANRMRQRSSKLLLKMGSVALFGGLLLALLYGWRFAHAWPWLTIPWMYATHGVLNSVGFALLTFLGRSAEEG